MLFPWYIKQALTCPGQHFGEWGKKVEDCEGHERHVVRHHRPRGYHLSVANTCRVNSFLEEFIKLQALLCL